MSIAVHRIGLGAIIMIIRILAFVLTLFIPAICTAQETAPPFPWRFVDPLALETDKPEAQVGDYAGGTIDGTGRVSIICRFSHLIHRFDTDGRWLGNIDRKGHGPGEFESASLITASYQGDLLILDRSLRRLTHLAPDGEYIASVSLNNQGIDLMREARIAFAGNDTYWISFSIEPVDRDNPLTRVISLLDQAGHVIWTREFQDQSTDIIIERPDGRGRRVMPNPARYIVRWSVDSEGTAWIITPDCRQLLRVDGHGEESAAIDLNLPHPGITAGEWREYLRSLEPSATANADNRKMATDRIDAIRNLLDDLPPIQYVRWASEAGLLIDRYARFRGSDTSMQLITALLPDGRLTSDSMNLDIQFTTFSNGFALASDHEYGELPRLIRYRIDPDHQ